MIHSRYILCLLIAFGIFTAVVSAEEGFPLRNGSFYEQHTSNQVSSWQYDDADGKQKITGRVELRLETVPGAPAAIQQVVSLPPGKYTFGIELAVAADSQAVLSAGDATLNVPPTPGFQKIELPFAAGEAPVTVRITSVKPGAVALRKARIDVISLTTGSVPTTDGSPIGRIVLPENPAPAERFAAWELQRFIHRMTGITPGLEGRDPVTGGRAIHVGGAPAAADPAPLDNEAYAININADSLTLAGQSPRATLYAVYDFLKTQGCGWYMPGEAGEVVPKIKALALPTANRAESPDWHVRGALMYSARFDSNNTHSYLDQIDMREWAVRNRYNSVWSGGPLTTYFPDYLGFAHQQRISHTWDSFTDEAHPEWYALVNGVRTHKHPSGRPNEPCTSNPDFRARVIDTILRYFKENPYATVYALNPEDEPANWCECEFCRAQDPDHGKGKWVTKANGVPPMSMSDRAVDFVNAVADAVAKKYPGKRIELYGYGSYRNGPEHHSVGPTVMIVYCYWPGVQLGGSVSDRSQPGVMRAFTEVDSWKKAGAKHFGLYDYGNYTHRDAPNFAFAHIVDSLKMFHDMYGFDHYMGETDNNVTTSAMAYTLRAEALWNEDVDWRDAMKKACLELYGPAGQTMNDYYTFMHKALEDWKPQWKTVGPDDPANKGTDPALPEWAGGRITRTLVGSSLGFYWSNDLIEFNTATMMRGQTLLKKAIDQANADPMLIRRIEIAEFAHVFMTYLVADKLPDKQNQGIASAALKRAVELWGKYPETLVEIGSAAQFGYVEPPAPIKSTIYSLPVEWKFHTDETDTGVKKGWPQKGSGKDWIDIRTDRDWTSQGHRYHGVAWYAVNFEIPTVARGKFANVKPQLHFDAIDGYGDIYLDGRLIGRQDKAPEVAWDKPCTIALPGDFDPAAAHTLVVRVKKDSAAAGIWKPVAIVASPE